MAGRMRNHLELSLEKKISLIKESELQPKPNQQQLAEKYKIGRSTVADIPKKKAIYLEQFEQNVNLKRQRLDKTIENTKLSELMWDWFREARAKNISLNGPLIQAKAKQFAEKLNLNEFKGRNGWLEKFERRHNIKS
jgi:transcriptional regulator with XRE-family HTH domain